MRNNFASPDSQRRAADVRHVQEWIEVAAHMGAPVLRVFAGAQPEGFTWDQTAEWMAGDLRQCVEYGKRYGVIVESGLSRGVLLPALEGIVTVEMQVAIACQKAGIPPGQSCGVRRFLVTRYRQGDLPLDDADRACDVATD